MIFGNTFAYLGFKKARYFDKTNFNLIDFK